MNCSCGYVNRWLMPCVHICSVLEHSKYYTPDLFHLRWWKLFHYLYKSNSKSKKVKSTTQNLKDSLSRVRADHYNHTNGMYKGVPIHDSAFLNDPMSNLNQGFIIKEDNKRHIIDAIWKMQEDDKPLIKGSTAYKNYMQDVITNDNPRYMNSNTPNDMLFDDIEESDVAHDMGAGSQVESTLSQQRIEMNEDSSSFVQDMPNSQTSTSNSQTLNVYSDLQPIFNDMIKQIKTKDQLDKAVSCLQKLNFEFKADSMKNRVIKENETLMLGEVNGSRRQETRHKFLYEKHRKSR